MQLYHTEMMVCICPIEVVCMVGWIQYRRGRGQSRLQSEILSGMTVLALPFYEPDGLSRNRLDRRIRMLERAFRRMEIGRVIVPDDFPYRDRLELIRPLEAMPLYRAVADLLVLDILDRKGISPGRARAALAGPRLCPELCEAAERLCTVVRELRIDVPGEEGENFTRYLQHEFGIPVIPRMVTVDAAIAFGETGYPSDLRLWGKQEIRLSAEGVRLPTEIEQPVLALLWEQGRVKREELRVINLP